MRIKVFQLVLALILGVAIWMAGIALATGVSLGHPGTYASRHHDSAENGSYGPASYLYVQTPSTQRSENLLAVLPSDDELETLNIQALRSAGARDSAWVSSPQVTAHHEPRKDPDQTPPVPGVTSSPLTFYWHISHGSSPVGARSTVAIGSDGWSYGDPSAPTYPQISMLLLGSGLLGLGFLRRRRPRAT
jgi:MYXO-CTERM domain-containing protein